ncbi:hypothetical protein ACVWW1_005084 [Bradyrhizobium sp. JR3.5]
MTMDGAAQVCAVCSADPEPHRARLNFPQTAHAQCKRRRVVIVQGFRGHFADLSSAYAATIGSAPDRRPALFCCETARYYQRPISASYSQRTEAVMYMTKLRARWTLALGFCSAMFAVQMTSAQIPLPAAKPPERGDAVQAAMRDLPHDQHFGSGPARTVALQGRRPPCRQG